MEILSINRLGTYRKAKLHGRDHYVVPMAMIKEGVLNGSKGPLFYSQSEIASVVDAWNGMPIVVYHPTANGNAISARSAEVLDKQGVGTVLNARMNKNRKLVAEAWIDIERAKEVDERIVPTIESGEFMEISTGLFTTNQPVKNKNYRGRAYTHNATQLKPDHLALLPDQKGACSIKDGCGLGVMNSESSNEEDYADSEFWEEDEELVDNDRWVTIKGAHVLVGGNGKVKAGPSRLKKASKEDKTVRAKANKGLRAQQKQDAKNFVRYVRDVLTFKPRKDSLVAEAIKRQKDSGKAVLQDAKYAVKHAKDMLTLKPKDSLVGQVVAKARRGAKAQREGNDFVKAMSSGVIGSLFKVTGKATKAVGKTGYGAIKRLFGKRPVGNSSIASVLAEAVVYNVGNDPTSRELNLECLNAVEAFLGGEFTTTQYLSTAVTNAAKKKGKRGGNNPRGCNQYKPCSGTGKGKAKKKTATKKAAKKTAKKTATKKSTKKATPKKTPKSIAGEEVTPPATLKPDLSDTIPKKGKPAKAARVGVAGDVVPPPPKMKSLPNLTKSERKVEREFTKAYERDPDGMANRLRRILKRGTKKGEPVTFGTDDAKVLHKAWGDKKLTLEQRSINRATLNTALHQTANAVTKRAFIQHLNTLKKGDEVMVTVGGCGAGKGYALKNVPDALAMKKKSKAVWDSAGDQNATENAWIQKEAEKRGLKVNYVFVDADPKVQWAHPDRGVVKRAQDPNDGRMVDAKVFADSYALGARNHQAFYQANKNNPNANFIFLQNGSNPKQIPGIPKSRLRTNADKLAQYALNVIARDPNIPPHVRRGATVGTRIWPQGVEMTSNEELDLTFNSDYEFDDSEDYQEELDRLNDLVEFADEEGLQVETEHVPMELDENGVEIVEDEEPTDNSDPLDVLSNSTKARIVLNAFSQEARRKALEARRAKRKAKLDERKQRVMKARGITSPKKRMTAKDRAANRKQKLAQRTELQKQLKEMRTLVAKNTAEMLKRRIAQQKETLQAASKTDVKSRLT